MSDDRSAESRNVTPGFILTASFVGSGRSTAAVIGSDDPRSVKMTSPSRCLVVVLAFLVLLSGCGNRQPAVDNTGRDAAVYRTVILDLVDRSTVDLDGTEEIPILFIEALGADDFGLPLQIEIIATFLDQYEIRFIDDRAEAIEIDLPRSPVRAGSLLIGLRPIVVDEVADIRAEVYTNSEDVRGYSYTLTDDEDGVWTVIGGPIPIEPDGLVPTS